MPDKANFPEIFRQLKAIFEPYASKLVVVHDTDSNYYLDTTQVMKNKHRIYFGSARIGKAYVSFHLMPVYAVPAMIETMSPELKKHMQGKSCFNFTRVDAKLFKELAGLTKVGFAKFSDPQFLEKIMRGPHQCD
jgi:hypothetical protein